MNKTVYDRGFEQGIERGIEKGLERGEVRGQQLVLRTQLEDRFGTLPQPALDRLLNLPGERLRSLARALLHAKSLKDLGLTDE